MNRHLQKTKWDEPQTSRTSYNPELRITKNQQNFLKIDNSNKKDMGRRKSEKPP